MTSNVKITNNLKQMLHSGFIDHNIAISLCSDLKTNIVMSSLYRLFVDYVKLSENPILNTTSWNLDIYEIKQTFQESLYNSPTLSMPTLYLKNLIII